MSFYKNLLYNSNQPILFINKPRFSITEKNDILIPRFKLKDTEIFPDFPINEPQKFDINLILKALQWGMIIQIEYKGAEDNRVEGHTRTIYPMALGYSSDNKVLIRGWQLNGWSVSQGTNLNKEWRLFRGDRILSISFTGTFFRLAPDGYVMRDKSMKRILGLADFNQIRNNQQTLLNQDKIDTEDRTVIKKLNKVVVKDMNFILNVQQPWRDNVLKKSDSKNIRITFAKPIVGNGMPIAIIGTLVRKNQIFKMYDEDNNLIGSYKTMKFVENGEELEQVKRIERDKIEFKMYAFVSSK